MRTITIIFAGLCIFTATVFGALPAPDPDDGGITLPPGFRALVFADNPLALRQWVVVDGQRQETRVSLFNVELGGKFDQALFQLPQAGPGDRR